MSSSAEDSPEDSAVVGRGAISDRPLDERVPAWTMPQYTRINEWLEGAKRIWLPLHVSPDGDCLGSSLAFAKALKLRGFDCVVISSDPIPDMYATLYDPEDVFVGAVPPGPPATHIACLDISDLKRTGDFYAANEASLKGETGVKVLNIDHHATNTQFGDLQLLDTAAPACAEQIAVALNELEWAVNAEIARYILLGIVTDTLGFRTPSTTARTLRVAAHMMERGGNLQEIVDAVFNTRPLAAVMLWGKVLNGVTCAVDGRVIYVVVTPQMLEETGAKEEDLEGLSSYLATVKGDVKVAAVLKEREDGTTRVSFRSQPGTDVAAIARHFGGGGHPLAAGATIPATGEEAERLFLEACEAGLDAQV
ncbi:MAG: bifunctional oligoribonuclease/PAP phosphatase NrnA [Chloroflexota bacterium]|nr:bifunctional oligoribonuclease/PAP phosphatase NrnA [Chloroflexota bacterium]MDQ5865397.1 bifunctional oligoribonuclease/PAP phosphatase NrnA [Chloroflexota bacterium]